MNVETATRIAAFLDAHHVVSLATCGPEGPHAANVFYVRDGFALLWVSDPATRHSMELVADARVSATVAPDCFDFGDIRGVQMSGNAHVLTSASDSARARLLLETRYPALRQLAVGPAALREAYARVKFYRLNPTRLLLIDNSLGFGHKEVLELGASPPEFVPANQVLPENAS